MVFGIGDVHAAQGSESVSLEPGSPEAASLEAARQLHPSALGAAPRVLAANVLADIASGLASTLDLTMPGDNEQVELLVTPSYEATAVQVEVDGCRLVGGRNGLPAAFAVAAGELMVWTADDAPRTLSRGAVCALPGHQVAQVLNIGDGPAVVVSAHALADHSAPADGNGTAQAAIRPGSPGAFWPCPQLAYR